jgi:hypothetical protein
MLPLIDGVLAVLVEIALLIGVGKGAYVMAGGGVAGWIAAFVGLAVIAVIWGIWAAPKSDRRLPMPGLAVLKAVLFAVGTVGWTAGPAWAWPSFAAAAGLSLALGIALSR